VNKKKYTYRSIIYRYTGNTALHRNPLLVAAAFVCPKKMVKYEKSIIPII
jgi:hypothetical protein